MEGEILYMYVLSIMYNKDITVAKKQKNFQWVG